MLQIIFLLVSIHGLKSVSSFDNLCPSVEDLTPCYCVSDGTNVRIDCMSVTSTEEVRKALISTKGIKRVYIDFLRSRLDHIPSDLFKGLHVTALSFNNCKLKSFGDEGRSALERLEDIIEVISEMFLIYKHFEIRIIILNCKAFETLGNGLLSDPRYIGKIFCC